MSFPRYDSDGENFDCEWYSQGNRCADHGTGWRNFNKTANEACCVCGGGRPGVSEPSAPTKSPTDPPTPSPTKAPTASPTDPPTPSPTNAPTPLDECPEGQAFLTVRVVTDANGSVDNSFDVKARNNKKKFKIEVWEENKLGNNASKSFKKCLPLDQCYIFIMWDTSRNGMCCEDGDGGFSVTWDGSIIADTLSNLSFKTGIRRLSPKFGTC